MKYFQKNIIQVFSFLFLFIFFPGLAEQPALPNCQIRIGKERGCSITLKNLCSIFQPSSSILEECQGEATILYPLRLASVSEGDIFLYFHGREPQTITNPQTEMSQKLKEPRYQYDQILEQILENKHYAMMAIIPHGSVQAQFSPIKEDPKNSIPEEPKGFLVNLFLKEILAKLQSQKIFAHSFQMHGLILGGHSAGGMTVMRLLEKPDVWGLPLKQVRMVTLFDGINGEDFELPFLQNFLTCSLQQEQQVLESCIFLKEKNFATEPFYFRAYYTGIYPYPVLHEKLQKTLSLLTSQRENVQEIKSRFRVLSMNKFLQKKVNHSELVRTSLRYALRVLPTYYP